MHINHGIQGIDEHHEEWTELVIKILLIRKAWQYSGKVSLVGIGTFIGLIHDGLLLGIVSGVAKSRNWNLRKVQSDCKKFHALGILGGLMPSLAGCPSFQ